MWWNGCWRRRCGRGGEFAEVFAEDKRSIGLGLDDGAVEQVDHRARDRGAGIRVVAGDTTGFAHTTDLSEARPGRGRRGRGRGGRAAAAAARGPWPSTRTSAATQQRRRALPGRRSPRPTRSSCCAVSTTPLGRPACRDRAGLGGYADSRKPMLVANSDGLADRRRQVRTLLLRCRRVADGDTGMQTGYHDARPHRRLRAVRHRTTSTSWRAEAARRALTKLKARPAPSGTLPVVIKHRQRRRAVPRGVRPRPGGRPRRQGRQRVRRARRRAGGLDPLRHARRRRHDGRGVGRSPSTTRAARAQRNVLIEDGVLTDYMWDLPARRARRGRPERQRPAPELHAPADGAHDEHLRARDGPATAGRHHQRRPTTACTSPTSAAARSTRRAATSCSA